MNKLPKNICMRCGRERVEVKVWKEKDAGGSTITVSANECPNSDCQKIVNSTNEKSRNKVIAMKLDREKRMRLLHRRSKSA